MGAPELKTMRSFDKVPNLLKQKNRWVLHKDKVPLQPNGEPASCTDQNTWHSFDAVNEAFRKSRGYYSGIMLALGDGIVGIDFDKCISDQGEIKTSVLSAIEDLDSYSEYSPSGTGLHTVVLGGKPAGYGCRVEGIECYDKDRFLTFTGDHFAGSPLTINERQEQLEIFHETFLKKKAVGHSKVVSLPVSSDVPENRLLEIIQAAEKGKGGKKFTRLFKQGDCSEYDGDESRAVLGLLSILRHHTQEPAELDALFRKSALYKGHWTSKWERLKHSEIATVLDGFSPSKKKKDTATFEDVCQLIQDRFSDKPPRRDLLSDELHVWFENQWQPALSKRVKGILESHMRHTPGFVHSSLEADVHRYCSLLKAELLVDIPKWDGRDRISELASITNVTNVTKRHFSELLKEWGATMLLRPFDHKRVQNKCIILKGKQGIGKDRFIENLVGGLGYLAENFTITSDEKRQCAFLKQFLVVKVPEFERVGEQITYASLKNLITSDGQSTIPMHGRVNERFTFRGSWIASANTFDFFRDPTGNRRFLVFVIDGIPDEAMRWEQYSETEEDKLQILAQFKQLAAEGYKASPQAVSVMDCFIRDRTPEDPVQQLLFDFDVAVANKLDELNAYGGAYQREMQGQAGYGWKISNGDLKSWGIYKDLAEQHSMKIQNIQRHLTAQCRNWNTARARGYIAIDRTVTPVTEVDEEMSSPLSHLNI